VNPLGYLFGLFRGCLRCPVLSSEP
jgi:hypothetical protein